MLAAERARGMPAVATINFRSNMAHIPATRLKRCLLADAVHLAVRYALRGCTGTRGGALKAWLTS